MQSNDNQVSYQDGSTADSSATVWSRDWSAHPALVDILSFSTIYAMSDIHGGYGRLTDLLVSNKIIVDSPDSPAEVVWAAGVAILVIDGDSINKGPKSVKVLELLLALSQSAMASGGRVVVLVGNHEAEFLADPLNSKASDTDGIGQELAKGGINPVDFVAVSNRIGLWLHQLPLGLRAGKWFFCHSGNTGGKSFDELDKMLRESLSNERSWGSKEIIGDSSIVESNDWFENPALPAAYAAKLNVAHIVFGHDPAALGYLGQIASDSSHLLFRIDVGMSPDIDYSEGAILRITHDDSGDKADELLPDGSIRQSWSLL